MELLFGGKAIFVFFFAMIAIYKQDIHMTMLLWKDISIR